MTGLLHSLMLTLTRPDMAPCEAKYLAVIAAGDHEQADRLDREGWDFCQPCKHWR